MTAVAVLPEADAAAAALASGAWQARLPAAGAGGDGCGASLDGLSGVIAPFIQPLVELHEMVSGDPGGLYQASMIWEVYTGNVQQAAMTFGKAQAHVEEHLRGASAATLAGILNVLADGTHSIADWSKVVSQQLQVCVRIVEIMRSLVCAGYELIIAEAGAIGDLFLGGSPWDIEQKLSALHMFAENCSRVIDTVVSNVERVFQLLRELVRLFLDLWRAIVPFHQALEHFVGDTIWQNPPGQVPIVSSLPGSLPTNGRFGDLQKPNTIPFPGSDLRFRSDHSLGYSHRYDLGSTELTTAELNQLFRQNFGHVFGPARLGDNSQLNTQLTHEFQSISTSLFGLDIPNITAGGIYVSQLTEDGFVVGADEGHPEYPGEVAFRLANVNGRAVFEVTEAYDETILTKLKFPGNTNSAFAAISDIAIWADTGERVKDLITYEP